MVRELAKPRKLLVLKVTFGITLPCIDRPESDIENINQAADRRRGISSRPPWVPSVNLIVSM